MTPTHDAVPVTRSPVTAQPRTDLPFLRTRSRPRVAPPAPAVAPAPAPTASTSLDLSPAPAPAVAPARPPVSSSLDLSPASSLDLPSAPPRRAVPPPAPSRRKRPRREAPSGRQTLLSAKTPTVTLSRIQSAVGILTVAAACGPGVGDLRLGCAYQLADGRSSTVQHEGGNRNGPDSGSPVVQAQRHEFQTVAVDLRRVGEITRLMVYAFSASHAPLAWGGTLIATTFGGAAVETAIELQPPSPVAALLSAYVVEGEVILRRAMVGISTTVKGACLAFGFERITWLDDWTPTS